MEIKEVPQALTEFIQSLESLRRSLNAHYLQKSKDLGCQIKANLDTHTCYYQTLNSLAIPEWQRRVAHSIWSAWSPPSLLSQRPRRRRPRPSLFPIKKDAS